MSLRPRAATVLVIAGLYAAGLVHWGLFFNFGNFSFRAFDWPKERMYFTLLADALREGRVPYHIRVSADYAREFPQFLNYPEEADASAPRTCRFLAMPETVVSPQILLAPLLEPGRFVLVHFLLLYSLGFLGSLALARRYGWSLLPFAAFFTLFNFNGYITAHLGVGHSMWGGYFLLPFFALFTLQWIEDGDAPGPRLGLAFTSFAMLLQGSLHVVVWCWLFVGLIALFNPRLWKGGVLVLGLSGLLSAYRLIPTAIGFWGFDRLPFSGGYPTLTDLLEALIVIKDPAANYVVPALVGSTYWWEFDVYVGLVALVVLLYFGIYRRFDSAPDLRRFAYAELDFPLLVVFLFSLSFFYWPLFLVPLLNSERVTSRIVIIPLIMLLVIACSRMERVLRRGKVGFKATVLFTAAVAETFGSLMVHSRGWWVGSVEENKQLMERATWHQLETATIISSPDPLYVAAVDLATGLSVLALVVWVFLLLRSRRLRAL